jgi:nitrogen fixation/metabolism regulation signal transduction histidine kinase
MRWSLEGKLAVLLFSLLLVGCVLAVVLNRLLGDTLLAIIFTAAIGVYPVLWVTRRVTRPIGRLLRAISGSIANYRDGEFGVSLVADRDDEIGDVLAAHNELGRALREQRLQLTQRELLLETVTQKSPVALVLVDAHRRVVYSNEAAQRLWNDSGRLLGLDFDALLDRTPPPLRLAASSEEDCLCACEMNGSEETFHVAKRSFSLSSRPHRLYLIRQLTKELSRQEVQTWKTLIRVLSHELNNSLGPISSLAQSGAELIRRSQGRDPAIIFAAIGERADHLQRFLSRYAEFARLPSPRCEWVDWNAVIDEVAVERPFRLHGPSPANRGWFDRAQIVQLLINLLKNAHEAGGPAEDIELLVTQTAYESRIEVRDGGSGMTDSIMHQALLPFYSTKRHGTGLGLALVREISEAHGGSIRLNNREGRRGLCATVVFPVPQDISRKEV